MTGPIILLRRKTFSVNDKLCPFILVVSVLMYILFLQVLFVIFYLRGPLKIREAIKYKSCLT